MASTATKRAYRAKGMVYVAQGQLAYPDAPPLEALCRHAEDRTNTLMPSTVRLYRRQYAAAAAKICKDAGLGLSDFEDAVSRTGKALDGIKGKPPEPQTSSKKVKDPRDWMIKEVFGHLKIMAVRHHRIRSAACALYCLLVPKLGTRPVELTKAWVEGNTLFVPSAKQPDGQKSVRTIDISDFHPTHREALLALIYIVDRDVEAGGYDAWLKRLAEILARACETLEKKTGRDFPRLSPSSFRHTAISTWHAAGFTGEEIAELVGHRDLRSQNAYKRSSSAWPMTDGLARPVQQEPPNGTREPEPRQSPPPSPVEAPVEEAGQPGPLLDLDDMPQPATKPMSDTGGDLWLAAREKPDREFGRINPTSNEFRGGGISRPSSAARLPK